MQSSAFTYYDEVPRLTISTLLRQGILTPHKHKQTAVKWQQMGTNAATAYIYCDTLQEDNQFIQISYEYAGKLVESKISLTTLPSNLGKGQVYYFICPQTKTRCSTLYLINGLFLHRSADSGTYRIKNKSKKAREYNKWIKGIYAKINAGKKLQQPYFKSSYAGLPTKRYTELTNLLLSK